MHSARHKRSNSYAELQSPRMQKQLQNKTLPSYMKPTESSSRNKNIRKTALGFESGSPRRSSSTGCMPGTPPRNSKLNTSIDSIGAVEERMRTPKYGKARPADTNGTPRAILNKIAEMKKQQNVQASSNNISTTTNNNAVSNSENNCDDAVNHDQHQHIKEVNNAVVTDNDPTAGMMSTTHIRGELEKCVCSICTCGRHRCPALVHRAGWDQDALNSTYQKTFRELSPSDIRSCRASPIRRPHTVHGAGHVNPDHFNTTNRTVYVPPSPDNYRRAAEGNDSAMMASSAQPVKTVPFQGMSTHKIDYNEKPLDRSRCRTPSRASTSSLGPDHGARFEGETTNKHDYRKWEMPRQQQQQQDRTFLNNTFSSNASVTQGSSYVDLTTTYKQDYQRPKRAGPARSVIYPATKTTQTFGEDDGPRYFDTTHKVEFQPKKLPVCPVLSLPKKVPSPLTGHLEYTMVGVNASGEPIWA